MIISLFRINGQDSTQKRNQFKSSGTVSLDRQLPSYDDFAASSMIWILVLKSLLKIVKTIMVFVSLTVPQTLFRRLGILRQLPITLPTTNGSRFLVYFGYYSWHAPLHFLFSHLWNIFNLAIQEADHHKCVQDLTTHQVLTMEFCTGQKV